MAGCPVEDAGGETRGGCGSDADRQQAIWNEGEFGEEPAKERGHQHDGQNGSADGGSDCHCRQRGVERALPVTCLIEVESHEGTVQTESVEDRQEPCHGDDERDGTILSSREESHVQGKQQERPNTREEVADGV